MLGIGTLAKKVFGTPNDRKVKSVRPLVAQVNALEDQFKELEDYGKNTEIEARLAALKGGRGGRPAITGQNAQNSQEEIVDVDSDVEAPLEDKVQY